MTEAQRWQEFLATNPPRVDEEHVVEPNSEAIARLQRLLRTSRLGEAATPGHFPGDESGRP